MRIRTRSSRSSRPTRSDRPVTACTRTPSTTAVHRPERRHQDAERHELMARSEHLLRRRAVSHALLRGHPRGTPDGPVRRMAEPAGNAFPLFGYGSFGYPLLTVAAAEVPSPSASAPPAGASSTPVASPRPATRRPAEAAAPFRSSWHSPPSGRWPAERSCCGDGPAQRRTRTESRRGRRIKVVSPAVRPAAPGTTR